MSDDNGEDNGEVASTSEGRGEGTEAAAVETLLQVKETREEMLARHRKEIKDLQAKDMALKKEAAKGSKAEQKARKKAVDEEIQKQDTKMRARHSKELASLGFGVEEASPVGLRAKVKEEVATLARAMAGMTAGVLGTSEGRVSKAQKRRDKRLQQDAERDQRIEEEKSGMVSERVVEDRVLKEKLQPLGLTLKEIKPDGHCLYRAVEDQLSLSGVQRDYKAVRDMAATYMRAHKEDFLPFIISEHGEEGGPGTDEDPEVRFEKYCHQVDATAAWGGHLELEALAHALQRHITVFAADLPDVHVGLQYEQHEQAPIRLSYHKHEYGLGEHYNSVVPQSAESSV